MRKTLYCIAILILLTNFPAGEVKAQQSLDGMIERELASLVAVYKMLHANPELSHYEEKTSAFVAKELRTLGYSVTERIGKYDRPEWVGYGVAAVLKNGEGPVVLVRADMDALPVEEKTGLPYASKVRAKNDAGQEVGVMHACGHDVHITTLLGTARMLMQLRDQWRGTLVLIGQPAEETIDGAKAMINDGLYSKVPRPDYAIALHDHGEIEAGKVGYTSGFALASSTSVDITVRGIGGHGSTPQVAKDPYRRRGADRHGAANNRQPRDLAARSGGRYGRDNSWRNETQHHPRRSEVATDGACLQRSSPGKTHCLHRAHRTRHGHRCRHPG
jgi:hippurate hydrolase